MIKGINHITLSVQNLERSFDFYRNTLGFRALMKNKKSAYFLAGDLWFCIEEDPETRLQALPEYTHIALTVDQKDFISYTLKLKQAGLITFKENKSEGDSFYFLDLDGHKLEIHVGNWKSRIEEYKKRSKTDFQFFEE
jgi:catechol 2,3-dioxygenase-like lactoylglutathione lyase family enzyme